jgi:hypothetical protein
MDTRQASLGSSDSARRLGMEREYLLACGSAKSRTPLGASFLRLRCSSLRHSFLLGRLPTGFQLLQRILDSLREIGEPNVGTYPSDRKGRLLWPIQRQTSACRHSKTGEELRSVHALLTAAFHIGFIPHLCSDSPCNVSLVANCDFARSPTKLFTEHGKAAL